jgi:hypothetical protein
MANETEKIRLMGELQILLSLFNLFGVAPSALALRTLATLADMEPRREEDKTRENAKKALIAAVEFELEGRG